MRIFTDHLIFFRYAGSRRSSIPETGHQLARLAEDSPASTSPPASPQLGGGGISPPGGGSPPSVPRPVLPGAAKSAAAGGLGAAPGGLAGSAPGGSIASARHNTNSLPRYIKCLHII